MALDTARDRIGPDRSQPVASASTSADVTRCRADTPIRLWRSGSDLLRLDTMPRSGCSRRGSDRRAYPVAHSPAQLHGNRCPGFDARSPAVSQRSEVRELRAASATLSKRSEPLAPASSKFPMPDSTNSSAIPASSTRSSSSTCRTFSPGFRRAHALARRYPCERQISPGGPKAC